MGDKYCHHYKSKNLWRKWFGSCDSNFSTTTQIDSTIYSCSYLRTDNIDYTHCEETSFFSNRKSSKNISSFSWLGNNNHSWSTSGNIIFYKFWSFNTLNGIKTLELFEVMRSKHSCIKRCTAGTNNQIINFSNLIDMLF